MIALMPAKRSLGMLILTLLSAMAWTGTVTANPVPVVYLEVDPYSTTTDLESGTYTFRVKATEPVNVPFTVLLNRNTFQGGHNVGQGIAVAKFEVSDTVKSIDLSWSNDATSVELEIAEPANREYIVHPSSEKLTIIRSYPNTDRPGVTVSSAASLIAEGDELTAHVRLTHRPNCTAGHDIEIGWEPAGLVSSIKGLGLNTTDNNIVHNISAHSSTYTIDVTSSPTSHGLGGLRFWSGETQRNIVLGTRSDKLANVEEGTITITAVKETAPCGGTYRPVYDDNQITTTVVVKKTGLEVDLGTSFENIFSLGNNLATYRQRTGSYTAIKASDVTIETSTVQELNGTVVTTPVYGQWLFASGSIAFTPANAVVNAMAKGDYATSTLNVNFKRGAMTVATDSVSIALWRPADPTMAFSSGQSSTIAGTNAASYPDLTGTGTFDIQDEFDSFEQFADNHIRMTVVEATGTPLQTLEVNHSKTNRRDTHMENDVAYIPVENGTTYGSWYFSPAAKRFIFRPNAVGINSLSDSLTATSTLKVELVDFGMVGTIAVTMFGSSSGPAATTPEMSVVATNTEITEGDTAWFKFTATPPPSIDTNVQIRVGDTGNYISTTKPTSILFRAHETEVFLGLPTNSDPNDPTDDIILAIGDGIGYEKDASRLNATVDVLDAGPTLEISRSVVSASENETLTLTVTPKSGDTITEDILVPVFYQDGVKKSLEQFHNESLGNGDYLADSNPHFVEMAANSASETISVQLDDDDVIEGTGQVVVGIARFPTSNFELETANSVGDARGFSFRVTDNESFRHFEVFAESGSVVENQMAVFRIVSPHTYDTDQTVKFGVTNTTRTVGVTLPTQATIKAGQTETTVEVRAYTDFDDPDPKDKITLQLKNQFGNDLTTPNNKAEVIVNDIGPHITISEDSFNVNEGDAVMFTFTASSAVTSDLILELGYSNAHHLIDPPERVRIAKGATAATIAVQTRDDEIYSGSHSFAVYIRSEEIGFEYNTSQINHQFEVDPERNPRTLEAQRKKIAVVDNEMPLMVSVAAVTDTIVEGEPARFKLTYDTLPLVSTTTFSVDLDVVQSGNYIRGNPTKRILLSRTELEVPFEIPTMTDASDTNDGFITVSLRSSSLSLATIARNPNNAASVTVTDRGPNITIGEVPTVNMGTSAVIPLTIAPALQEDLVIPVMLRDGVYQSHANFNPRGGVGDVIAANPPVSLLIPKGATTATLTIPTKRSTVRAGDGAFVLQLGAPGDARYELDSGNSSNDIRVVRVLDQIQVPTVTVRPGNATIKEGEMAEFVFTASAASANDLEILYGFTDVGEFVEQRSGIQRFRLPAGSTSGTLRIPTQVDGRSDRSGSLIVVLISNSGYVLSGTSSNTATIAVTNSGPLVRVTPVETVDEAETIEFAVQVLGTFTGSITIPVAISDGTNRNRNDVELQGSGSVLGSSLPNSVTITSSNNPATLSISTVRNNLNDLGPAGVVRIEFDQGVAANYNIEDNRPYNVTVLDADSATITIAPAAASVVEGETARFTVRADTASAEPLFINISTAGDLIEDGFISIGMRLPAGATSAVLEVPTKTDGIATSGETVVATLQDGYGYAKTSTAAMAEATVNVTDAGPVVTLVNPDQIVTEGTTVTYNVSLSGDATGPVSIPYYVSDGVTSTFPDGRLLGYRDVLASSQPGMIQISSGRTGSFTLTFKGNSLDNDDGTVALALGRGTGFEPVAGEILIVVQDDEDTPLISITAFAASGDRVTEGEEVVLRVRAVDSVSERDLRIYVSATDSDSLVASSVPEFVILPAGMSEVTFPVQTQPDDTSGTNTTFTVTVGNGPGYTPRSTSASEVITVTNVSSILTITTNKITINEGESCAFNLTPSSALDRRATLPVYYSDGHTSTFPDNELRSGGLGNILVHNTLKNEATVNAASTTPMIFSQPIAQNDLDVFQHSTSAQIVIEIHRPINANFEFSAGNSFYRDICGVLDNDDPKPELSIEAVAANIVEGDTARFLITSVGKSDQDLTIPITAGSRSYQVVLPTGMTSTMLEIPTLTNGFAGTSDSIIVELVDGEGYTLDATKDEATVQVRDGGRVVTVAGGSSSVVEGTNIVLTFTLLSVPSEDLTIHAMISDGISSTFPQSELFGEGDVLNAGALEPLRTITITTRLSTQTLTIPTVDDSTDEGYGRVRVAIIRPEGQKYEFNGRGDPVYDYIVTDNDNAPVVTVASATPSTNQGFLATFRLMASAPAATDYEIMVSVTETGNYYAGAATAAATMEAGDREVLLELETIMNSDQESDGMITVELLETGRKNDNTMAYSAGDTKMASLTVLRMARVPILSVTAPVSVVENALMVQFTLTLDSVANPGEFDIRYVLTEMGGGTFLATDQGYRIGEVVNANVDFTGSGSIGNYRALLTFNIVDDDVEEPTGSLKVELRNSVMADQYTVSSVNHSATVRIFDDDSTIPIIHLVAGKPQIQEGESAEFSITAIPAPAAGTMVEIPLTISQMGDFVLWRVPRFARLDSSGRFPISILTNDDNEDEENGRITVELPPMVMGFEIETRKQSVTVNDNDEDNPPSGQRLSLAATALRSILMDGAAANGSQPLQQVPAGRIPELSIDTDMDVVDEGESIRFQISSDRSPGFQLRVWIELTEAGRFITGSRTFAVEFAEDRNEVGFTVGTEDDAEPEADGSVTASLVHSSEYAIHGDPSRQSATVRVSDEADRQRHREKVARAYQRINAANMVVLPEMAGTLGAGLRNAVQFRVTHAFSANTSPEYKFGGQSTMVDLLRSGGDAVNRGDVSWQQVLGDSHFKLDLYPETGYGSSATVWGLGDHREIDRNGSLSPEFWQGDVFVGHMGVDVRVGVEFVTGLVATATESDMDYGVGSDDPVRFGARTTGLHPFLAYRSSDGTAEYQVLAGYGMGAIGIKTDLTGRNDVNTEYLSVATGGSRVVYSGGDNSDGNSRLRIRGEGWMTRQYVEGDDRGIANVRVGAAHYNLALEGGREFPTAGSGVLQPSLSAGVRVDERDRHDFAGFELTGRINFHEPVGLTVASQGALLMSGSDGINGTELKGSVGFDRDRDDLGLLLEFKPSWSWSGAESYGGLWSRDLLDHEGSPSLSQSGTGFESEVGYGFVFSDGNWTSTPFTALELSREDRDSFRIGNRFELGRNAKLELTGSERLNSSDGTGHKIELDGSFSW